MQPREGVAAFDQRKSFQVFPALADLLREFAEANGCTIYVSTNSRSITLDRQRTGRGEYDIYVKVRGDGG